MKTMIYKKMKLSVALGVAGMILLSANTFAASTSSVRAGVLRVHAGANASTSVARAVRTMTGADTEITNRINALNALESRVNAMQKLSSSEKNSLSSQIQMQVTAMTDLRTRITADEESNNTSSLKTDVQSITKSYRIYALIVPQGTIAAAADRVIAIANAMTTLSGTLQTRISTAQSLGVDMASSVSALADLKAKVADANTQAQAAISATVSLTPDNGSSTTMQANTAALKSARTDIQAAQKDLVAARQGATKIIASVKAAEKIKAATSTAASTH